MIVLIQVFNTADELPHALGAWTVATSIYSYQVRSLNEHAESATVPSSKFQWLQKPTVLHFCAFTHRPRTASPLLPAMAHMFRIQCRASDDLSLAIVNGEVILAKSDPRDDRQARPSSLLLRFCVTFTSFPCLGHARTDTPLNSDLTRSFKFAPLSACLAQGRTIQCRAQGRGRPSGVRARE